MANAATLLADFLMRTEVEASNESTETVRTSWGQERDMTLEEVARHAAELLVETAQALNDLRANGRDVSYLEESLDAWTRAVFVPGDTWQIAGRPGDQISDADLRFLRALAERIDDLGYEPFIDETDIEAVRETIHEATEMLRDLPELPSDVRTYVTGLLLEARTMLSNWDFYSGSHFRKTTIELSGAMHVVAGLIEEQAPEGDDVAEKKASWWRRGAKRITTGLVQGASSETGRRAIEYGTKAIESGLG